MKVGFATYDTPTDVGGVSSWLQRLLPRLQDVGIDVEAHVLAYGGQPGINCAGFAAQGIPYHCRPWEDDTKKAAQNCLKILEESQPDVYVPNCILPAYYAAGYARQQGIHTVGVLHSDDPFYWGLVDEFVNGLPARRLSAVVAVSNFLLEAIMKSTKRHNLITRRIGCGVPLPAESAEPPKDIFRMIYTGRLVEEQKCISEVARALCSVVKQNPGTEAWIVGDGKDRVNVEQIIATCGVDPKRVKLLGRVAVSEIYSVLRQCHAFVLLSDYEGLPISMLEAMATGVVPVCLDMRSGIREAIQPGFNGLIVKDRQEDFYAAILSLIKEPPLWAKLSANARRTVHQKFSEAAGAAAWTELLGSFKDSKRVKSFKSPFWIRLPRRNSKFGHYDQRLLPFSKNWNRLRIRVGFYRRQLLKPFNLAA
jgi:glycosyltransferase involved in cell wall biosynthesis